MQWWIVIFLSKRDRIRLYYILGGIWNYFCYGVMVGTFKHTSTHVGQASHKLLFTDADSFKKWPVLFAHVLIDAVSFIQ